MKQKRIEYFGINWHIIDDDKTNYPALIHDEYCVEFNRNKKVWQLYENIDYIFESDVLALVLMVAKEQTRKQNVKRQYNVSSN